MTPFDPPAAPGRRALLRLLALLPGMAAAAPSPTGRSPDAAAWLAQAEAALLAGRPQRAVGLFERAARLDDERPDAEMGQVRAWLQAGERPQALAWARLVAGEHPAWPWANDWADAVEAMAAGPAPLAAPAAGLHPMPGRTFPPPPARRPLGAREGDRYLPVAGGLVDGPARRLLLPPAALSRLQARPDVPRWVTDGTGALMRLAADGRTLEVDDPSAERPASWRDTAPAPVDTAALAGRRVRVIDAPFAAGSGAVTGCGRDWPRLSSGVLTWPAGRDDRLRLDLPGAPPPDGTPVFDACGGWLGWCEGGALTPAPSPAAAACAAMGGAAPSAFHDRWYAALATVWQPA